MNLDDLQKLRELHKLFVDLVNILEQESEKNWIHAIKPILERIDYGLSRSCEYEEIINYVSINFKAINAGNGSFSDFYIWRDDFADRKRANLHLATLKNEILILLE